MLRIIGILAALLLAIPVASGQEPTQESADATSPKESGEKTPDGPKTMSGMSILGNEEAPKALVIVPWKSSELGDDLSLTDTLDDRARPVDKDVFRRELGYYEILSGKK